MSDDYFDDDDEEGLWDVPPSAVVVPRLTGCCQGCGRKATIEMSRVNTTVCISIVAHPECSCRAHLNLWPVAPHSVVAPADGAEP